MKTYATIALSLALGAALAGCDKPKAEEKAVMTDAGTMAMPAETIHGKSAGTVTAIDTATGQVMLDHGAIAELDWPPMTMSFAAPQQLLEGLAVGDRVSFELDWDGKAGTITRIEEMK